MCSLVLAHLNIAFIAWPRLSKAPVTFQGGLRDDSTGVHSFIFMLRRGAIINDSTHPHSHVQLAHRLLSWCQFTCIYLSCLYFWQIYLTTWWCQRPGVDLVARSTHWMSLSWSRGMLQTETCARTMHSLQHMYGMYFVICMPRSQHMLICGRKPNSASLTDTWPCLDLVLLIPGV